jgi:hypothetical protein
MKNFGLTEIELTNLELTGRLKHAIDNNFQRIVENARHEWQQRFAGKEPGDSCVSVRISKVPAAPESSGVPGSGFVKPSKRAAATKRKLAWRPAH